MSNNKYNLTAPVTVGGPIISGHPHLPAEPDPAYLEATGNESAEQSSSVPGDDSQSPFLSLFDNFIQRGERCVAQKIAPADLKTFDRVAILALSGVAITFWKDENEMKVRVPSGFEIKWTGDRYDVEAVNVVPAKPKQPDQAQVNSTGPKRFFKTYSGRAGVNSNKSKKRKARK